MSASLQGTAGQDVGLDRSGPDWPFHVTLLVTLVLFTLTSLAVAVPWLQSTDAPAVGAAGMPICRTTKIAEAVPAAPSAAAPPSVVPAPGPASIRADPAPASRVRADSRRTPPPAPLPTIVAKTTAVAKARSLHGRAARPNDSATVYARSAMR